MDVLSEVLKSIRLDAAFFYNAEFTAPWSVREPRSEVVATQFAPGSRHMIIYHLVTEGRCAASLEGGKPIEIGSGDIVIFPHGDAHILGSGSAKTVDLEPRLPELLAQGLKLARAGGGGETTRIVCGYMSCDPQLSSALLAGLPPLFRVPIRDDAGGQWLENTIRFSVAQAGSASLGGEAVLSKLSEVLFVETIRRYIAQLPPEERGWLAGARDPEVGRALALLHRAPAKPWTIAMLAREIGTSRTVLAERFRHYLNEPPIAYLTSWRLLLAAQMLRSSSRGVADIGADVGYESEAAFNRAFKRRFNVPPARFRGAARRAADIADRTIESSLYLPIEDDAGEGT
jgi:AraC-like DNA-binding protein